MSATPTPLARADRGEIGIIVGAALVSLTVAGTVLVAGDSAREATRLALRLTARLSFVYFMLAFVASPLARLRPGPASRQCQDTFNPGRTPFSRKQRSSPVVWCHSACSANQPG